MEAVVTQKFASQGFPLRWKFNWIVPCVLVLAGLGCLLIDVPLAYHFEIKHAQLPKFIDRPLREALENCETFGHGFGVTLIVIAVGALDPLRRKCLPWVFAGSWGSGLAANTLKLLVHRTRPRDFDFQGPVWSTFVNTKSGGMDVQSFPSAHTATAFGLAVMLATLYPRGRWFFAMLAILVGFQRIVCSAHFASDVCAGATVGWLVGTICANLMTPVTDGSDRNRATV